MSLSEVDPDDLVVVDDHETGAHPAAAAGYGRLVPPAPVVGCGISGWAVRSAR